MVTTCTVTVTVTLLSDIKNRHNLPSQCIYTLRIATVAPSGINGNAFAMQTRYDFCVVENKLVNISMNVTLQMDCLHSHSLCLIHIAVCRAVIYGIS
jgi:hypothetical protein